MLGLLIMIVKISNESTDLCNVRQFLGYQSREVKNTNSVNSDNNRSNARYITGLFKGRMSNNIRNGKDVMIMC